MLTCLVIFHALDTATIGVNGKEYAGNYKHCHYPLGMAKLLDLIVMHTFSLSKRCIFLFCQEYPYKNVFMHVAHLLLLGMVNSITFCHT